MPGEGSIFPVRERQVDGSLRTVAYRAQVSVGPRGSRRYLTRTRPTKKAAGAALAELLDDVRQGRDLSKQSLGDYLRRWLADTVAPTISPNTLRGYEDAVAHLAPIAEIAIADLRPEDVERALAGMTTRRIGAKPAPAAPKTVRNVQVVLRRALDQAVARGHVRRNVAELVPLRRVPRQGREAMTPESAHAILAAIRGDRYEAAFALAFMGLRAGEILGLGWDDVHLASPASVTIRYQLVGSGKGATRSPILKTASSEGSIPLPPFVVSRLRVHQARQKAERKVVSLDGGLVFVTERGYGVSNAWLTKHFQSLLSDAGLPKMRLHDMRHGAASLLVGAGAHPRVAQELLRHAPGSRMTMAVYAHVTGAQQREAADLLQVAVAGKSRGKSRTRKTGS